MVEAVFDILINTIIPFLFRYPGAFIRWLFVSNQRSFNEVLKEDDILLNSSVGMVIIIPAIIIIIVIVKA